MPEIPEIASRAREMNQALPGKRIIKIQVEQPKALNIPLQEFIDNLINAVIKEVTYHGKWLFVETSQGWLLLNMGMGGEILLVEKDCLPVKHCIVFEFNDNSCLSINFWWFGYVHFVNLEKLNEHKPTSKLGPNILDLSEEEFTSRIVGQKGKVKTFLLDQTQVAGIGNAYIHDILFFARLHPLRVIKTLSPFEIHELYQGIQKGLRPSLEKGGAFYEMNLFGEKGKFLLEDIVVGYREGQPCPKCQTPIEKIKTGGTSSFICPHCQSLS